MNCRLLLALVLITAATWATAGPSDKCQLVKITEWSVRKDHYRPVVDGSINGQKIGVLLDTGAFQTAILRPAAERLGLRRVMLDGQRVYGIGGETRAEAAYVDELNIAGSVRKDWPALVVGEHGFSGDVALLLGHEFFEQLDVEFDLAQRVVRLFQPRNCERAWLGYWSSNASMVPLETNSRIHLTVRINGQPILAMLDSGVGYSSYRARQRWCSGLRPIRQAPAPLVASTASARNVTIHGSHHSKAFHLATKSLEIQAFDLPTSGATTNAKQPGRTFHVA